MPGEQNLDNNHGVVSGLLQPPLERVAVELVGGRLDRDRGAAVVLSSRSRSRSCFTSGCARSGLRSRRCSGAAAATSSTSPSRSRAGSTGCTARSTSSRRRSGASSAASTRRVSRLAVVRYDAYENTGGHQSASVALLDASRTGVVLTAIQGRGLRADLRQGTRRRSCRRLALARGAGGGGARHEVAAVAASGAATFRAGCSTFLS